MLSMKVKNGLHVKLLLDSLACLMFASPENKAFSVNILCPWPSRSLWRKVEGGMILVLRSVPNVNYFLPGLVKLYAWLSKFKSKTLTNNFYVPDLGENVTKGNWSWKLSDTVILNEQHDGLQGAFKSSLTIATVITIGCLEIFSLAILCNVQCAVSLLENFKC